MTCGILRLYMPVGNCHENERWWRAWYEGGEGWLTFIVLSPSYVTSFWKYEIRICTSTPHFKPCKGTVGGESTLNRKYCMSEPVGSNIAA